MELIFVLVMLIALDFAALRWGAESRYAFLHPNNRRKVRDI